MEDSIPVPLRRPNRPGFMAPFILLEMVNAIEDLRGPDALDDALKDAQVFRLPEADEPVREDKVARVHQTVRRLWPDQSKNIGMQAGAGAAQRIMDTQFSPKAKSLLGKMPRATGAWLLAKTAGQNAWTFSGSGEFVVESETRFILRENPLVSGETAQTSVCHFHARLFEKLFSALIHPRLICNEVSCHAQGDEACVFEFTMTAA